MNTSETVQAAQRLLAEREAVGLKKYGTTVDRADLKPRQWLRHAIEEVSDLLLYLMRLEQTMRICEGLCGQTMDTDPPEFGPVPDPSLDRVAEAFRRKAELGHVTYPAEAPEDAERAAYLARWKGAPSEAAHLWEALSGECFWLGEWFERPAGTNLIGRASVEPRPTPEGGQGVGP
jgi:hypothetical protein